jgi:hypothetical protein
MGADRAAQGGSLPLFGSLMPYILDQVDAAPIIALRPDEKHARNLEHLDMASLVVYPLTPANINPSSFALPRVNLAGRLRKLEPSNPGDSVTSVRREYLAAHPGCKVIIDDLSFYKLEIEDTVYCSGGLQETTHVTFDKYKSTQPDVVMQGSRSIVEWMNDPKRAIYLKLFCQEYGQLNDVGEIFMFSVDRKGFEVMAWRESNRNWVELRFPFPYEMKSVEDCRGGLLDSCAFLHDKYLKDVEGGDKFSIEDERRRENERIQKQKEEEDARRREMSEPEF